MRTLHWDGRWVDDDDVNDRIVPSYFPNCSPHGVRSTRYYIVSGHSHSNHSTIANNQGKIDNMNVYYDDLHKLCLLVFV